MKSVHITEAEYLLLEVSTTTLSPSIWHMMSVHMTEATFLLLEVSTTTLSPSIWQLKEVPILKAQFLLLEVSITTLSQNIWHTNSVHITEAEYLLLEVSILHWVPAWCQYTSLRPRFYCYRSALIPWGPVSDTIRSVHITEANVLLLEVSSTTLSPSIWHNNVSTHDWGQVSTVRGQNYYIES